MQSFIGPKASLQVAALLSPPRTRREYRMGRGFFAFVGVDPHAHARRRPGIPARLGHNPPERQPFGGEEHMRMHPWLGAEGPKGSGSGSPPAGPCNPARWGD